MREFTERIIELDPAEDAEVIAEKIVSEASKMHEDGWFFQHSQTDGLMEKVYLFFERDIEDV